MKPKWPLLLLLLASAAFAQTPGSDLMDELGLARLKDYSAHRVSSNNRYKLSNDDSKRIMPGETLEMANLEGPGMVTHLWLTVAASEYAWPRLLRLRVYYDGSKTPSVDAPVGDFFGVAHGESVDLDSVMIRDASFGRARNSYWPMPFRRSCRITVTNEGDRFVFSFYYHVDYRRYRSLPSDVGYFHAYYRQERPAAPDRNYEFLNIRGHGHYVGTVLGVIQSEDSWFGEGDDLFYVDGGQYPQLTGTGSEDYFNDAWGLRVTSGPWTGTPIAEGERVGSRLSGYRWHVPDPVPFTKSLWAGIEHAGWTSNPDGSVRSGFEERPDYFSSVAFWYQEGVNEGLPEPPYGHDRLPMGNALQIAVEDSLADVKATQGQASVQREVDWGKDLLFFQAQGQGARIDVPIDVPETGRYEMVAEVAQAPDYGDYVALVDGKNTNLDTRQPATSEIPFPGLDVYHNYLPEVHLSVERPLGWFNLSAGPHTLTFACVGKDSRSVGYNFGLQDVVLERLAADAGKPEAPTERPPSPAPPPAPPAASKPAPAGTPVYRGLPLSAYRDHLRTASAAGQAEALRALGSFGVDAAPAVEEIAASVESPDLETRRAACWALAQMGPAGAPAVPKLARLLSDSSPQIRSMAATAIGAIGPKASAAVPELSRALDDPVDYVRASAANGLGGMGAAGAGGVAALARVLTREGEPVMVGRSVAAALGDMGPAAREALPALEHATHTFRVSYTAEEAILKVKGQPVPTWVPTRK